MSKLTLKTVSFLFNLGMVMVSCKGDDDSSDTPDTAQPVVQNFGSFSADLDGANFEMVATLLNDVDPNVGSYESTDATVSPFVTEKDFNSSLDNSVKGEAAGVSVGTVTFSGSQNPSKSAFVALFSPGNKNYEQNLNNGVEVYVNINGVTWSISNGTADQSGSTFTITSAAEGEVAGTDNVEIEATFSCTLYDDSGNSKALTNGKFKGLFENS